MVGEALRPSSDFLLDTGIIARHFRNDKRAHDLLDYLEETGGISASAITYLEILVGSRPSEEEAVKLFFGRVSPLIIDAEIARKAASLIRKYPAVFGRDNPRSFPDAVIAATAWHLQSTLVTLNTRHFAKASMTELAIQVIDQSAGDWVSTLKN